MDDTLPGIPQGTPSAPVEITLRLYAPPGHRFSQEAASALIGTPTTFVAGPEERDRFLARIAKSRLDLVEVNGEHVTGEALDITLVVDPAAREARIAQALAEREVLSSLAEEAGS